MASTRRSWACAALLWAGAMGESNIDLTSSNLELSPSFIQLPLRPMSAASNLPDEVAIKMATPPNGEVHRQSFDPNSCCIGHYAVPLTIGHPGTGHAEQELLAIMDTGSRRLWLMKDCDAYGRGYSEGCKRNKLYDPLGSTTAVKVDDGFVIDYVGLSVNGSRFRDDVCFTGTTSCVKNFTFGLASSAQVAPKNKILSSVLGLSYAAPNPFLEGLLQQGLIESEFFSITVNDTSQSDHAGHVVFGAVDRGRFKGQLHEVPARKDMMFQVPEMGSVHRGQKPKLYGKGQASYFCEVDTGNKAMIVPTQVYQGFMKDNFPDNKAKSFPLIECVEAITNNASLYIGFGTFSIEVPMEKMLVDTGEEYCRLLIAAQAIEGSTESVCSFGTPLLFSTYTVFDKQTPAMYFGPSANCGSSIVGPKVLSGKHGNLTEIKGLC